MFRSRKISEAFTLLEMLIVIVIIAILAGMILKLMSLSKHFQAKSSCLAVIERVSYALNEYRAEYGQYPPVSNSACISLNDCHPTDCRTCYTTAPGVNGSTPPTPGAGTYLATYGGPGLFSCGLVSYLITNFQGATYASLPGYSKSLATAREETVKRRWQPFLTNLVDGCENRNWHGNEISQNPKLVGSIGSSTFKYYVPRYTLMDPWWRVLRYRSSAPYSSYDFWSAGPDGADGDGSTADWRGQPKAAKDNVNYKHGKWGG